MTHVIAGAGIVGPHGVGIAPLREALARGAPLATAVERKAPFHRDGDARDAALVASPDLREWIAPAAARRMSDASRWLVAAAKMALADAEAEPDARTRVDVATCLGPSRFTERLVQEIQDGDPQLCSPFLFTDCVANAPAGQVAIALGCKGANHTFCQQQAGQLLALQAAVNGAGESRAIVGVVDEMPGVVHAFLARLGALARGAPRPFCKSRDGILAGEGACALVIEPESRARRRLARVVAMGRAFDPSAPQIGWGHGHAQLANAMRASGVDARAIDAVVCSASGAREGDRLEAQVLRALFGARVPPLLVPKGVLGEYGAGVLVPALLALEGARFARPVGFRSVDPALGLVPHDGDVQARRVLVNAFAAGGAAAWVVLERA